MSCSDLVRMRGHQDGNPSNVRQVIPPYIKVIGCSDHPYARPWWANPLPIVYDWIVRRHTIPEVYYIVYIVKSTPFTNLARTVFFSEASQNWNNISSCAMIFKQTLQIDEVGKENQPKIPPPPKFHTILTPILLCDAYTTRACIYFGRMQPETQARTP